MKCDPLWIQFEPFCTSYVYRYVSVLLQSTRYKMGGGRKLLIHMEQKDPVINETDVTSNRCDRLAHMTLSDDLSTSRRPFQNTR